MPPPDILVAMRNFSLGWRFNARPVTVSDQPIFTDANYGTVYVNNTANGGIYSAEANIIQAALYYYCSAGYFGTFVETLTLPAE